jgi:hypothetical protein
MLTDRAPVWKRRHRQTTVAALSARNNEPAGVGHGIFILTLK